MRANRFLYMHLTDRSQNQIIQYTAYKAESAGTSVVLIDPKYTSQKELVNVGRDTPEVTPVEIGALPMVTPVAETGSPSL